MAPTPALIIVMGASGCGKSTVGLALAQALAIPFIDGDDLHPASNVAKMSAGHPLTDEDRIPWLHRIREDAILLTSQPGLNALDTPQDGTPDPAVTPVSHELSVALSRIQAPSLQARVEAKARGEVREREGLVVACSALKKTYRDLLRGEEATVVVPPPEDKEIQQGEHLQEHIQTYFVYLQGTRPLLLNRMQNRAGHFMKAGMLDSQLATLQEPHETDEPRITVVPLGQGSEGSEERGKSAVIDEAVRKIRAQLGE
ncbi:gluconokinase [Sporobolomyces koalae]|uniref:gluconokinase n=1 Tax=Sporobolomyces koalae TaxID=500713 RepID=UPI00317FE2E3